MIEFQTIMISFLFILKFGKEKRGLLVNILFKRGCIFLSLFSIITVSIFLKILGVLGVNLLFSVLWSFASIIYFHESNLLLLEVSCSRYIILYLTDNIQI